MFSNAAFVNTSVMLLCEIIFWRYSKNSLSYFLLKSSMRFAFGCTVVVTVGGLNFLGIVLYVCIFRWYCIIVTNSIFW